MHIFTHIENSLQKKLPFVAYKKPNSTSIASFFQNNDTLVTTTNFYDSGFVFAPFDDTQEAILIPEKEAVFREEMLTSFRTENSAKNIATDVSSKENHINLVQKGITAIDNGLFKKVVLSRKELVTLESFDVITVFKNLLASYPNAMVYVWYHPHIGMWLGATPETLVKIANTEFETMALAGTQPFVEGATVAWTSKEIDEQQFVTDYIVEKLTPICSQISTSDTETIKAGSLLHLKTKIQGSIKTDNTDLIKTLHPTPAVCGLPKNSSKDFILSNELYKRTFYTGFLGELNLNNNTQLFVNLRCMEIQNNNALIYIGGGITKDSTPEKEWEETVAKAMVMKKVL
ncbi:chorismate-binding protein [Tenacibaculum sp. TC6]|uniref:chorismate-binding protein n=1 Tax=Tenacibaculum sp. TC6 TaxID=3423223 RepID=UPI003D35BFF3